jgi:hypothetical protein
MIQILNFYPSGIPDPGVKKAPDPGYGILHPQLDGGLPKHILEKYTFSRKKGVEVDLWAFDDI